MSQESPRRHPVVPRRVEHPFAESDIPRYWLADDAVATHVSNGVNLLFPAGERFFVRSVRHFEDRVTDPELREQVRGFYGQEGRHAREHERFFDVLREQGYALDRFIEAFDRSVRYFESRLPRELSLAATAAAEHFTALMAAGAFEERDLENFAHPVMRDLLLWHAAEEIEHKSVAFDVLREVDPRYRVRVAGMLVASLYLATWWTLGTAMLLRQDGIGFLEFRRRLKRLRGGLSQRRIGRDVFARGIRAYLRRDFHPWEVDDLHLAVDYLAKREDAAPKRRVA